MNLIKCFNFSYLKENIKKSRGLIALLLLVVPLFTIISIVFITSPENYTKILTNSNIMIPNILGMIVIPYVLSVALFGYVYEKPSVDFINSMPLNRKTIFITNTICGILIITLIQLLTLIVTLICDMLLSTIQIFPQMLIDIFITMWLAYFFIFTATNLAMSISGTIYAQLVLTVIILCIVPFCSYSFQVITENYYYSQYVTDITDEVDVLGVMEQESQIYTWPCNIINGINNSYSTTSNVKMIILGIIYFFIGLKLFQKRKFENAGESFGNKKMHLIIKALTVFPMIVILNLMELDIGVNILFVCLIVLYYFVYDFIIKKKINFLVSVLSLVVTLGISQLIVFGVQNVGIEDTKIERDDIQKIAITCEGFYNYYGNSVYDNEYEKLNIENQEEIDLIYECLQNGTEEYNQYIENIDYDNASDYQYDVIYSQVTLNNGKKYNTISYISESYKNKIIDILATDSDYVQSFKNECVKNGVFTLSYRVIEKQDELSKYYNSQIDSMSLQELLEVDDLEYWINLQKICYENHKLTSKDYLSKLDSNILQIVADESNKFVKKVYNGFSESTTSISLYTGNLEEINENILGFDGRFYINQKAMLNFIQNNVDEKVDASKSLFFVIINYYDVNNNEAYETYFFTNKIDEVSEMIEEELSGEVTM